MHFTDQLVRTRLQWIRDSAYALFIGFFVLLTLTLAEIPGRRSRAGMISSVVLLLVGAAMAFKTVVSLSHAPEQLASFILSLSENPLILLFLINLLLFVVGMFLHAGPATIILGPILVRSLSISALIQFTLRSS